MLTQVIAKCQGGNYLRLLWLSADLGMFILQKTFNTIYSLLNFSIGMVLTKIYFHKKYVSFESVAYRVIIYFPIHQSKDVQPPQRSRKPKTKVFSKV